MELTARSSSYLVLGSNRRGRVVHNNGNVQSVHVREPAPCAPAPDKGSTVCSLL